jgi:hypothetical protein
LSFVDGFLAAAVGAYVCLVLVALLQTPAGQKGAMGP